MKQLYAELYFCCRCCCLLLLLVLLWLLVLLVVVGGGAAGRRMKSKQVSGVVDSVVVGVVVGVVGVVIAVVASLQASFKGSALRARCPGNAGVLAGVSVLTADKNARRTNASLILAPRSQKMMPDGTTGHVSVPNCIM